MAKFESGDDREGSNTSWLTLSRRIKIKGPNHRIIWSRRFLYLSLRRGEEDVQIYNNFLLSGLSKESYF